MKTCHRHENISSSDFKHIIAQFLAYSKWQENGALLLFPSFKALFLFTRILLALRNLQKGGRFFQFIYLSISQVDNNDILLMVGFYYNFK